MRSIHKLFGVVLVGILGVGVVGCTPAAPDPQQGCEEVLGQIKVIGGNVSMAGSSKSKQDATVYLEELGKSFEDLLTIEASEELRPLLEKYESFGSMVVWQLKATLAGRTVPENGALAKYDIARQWSPVAWCNRSVAGSSWT